jgi:predicted MFS family arabinose efflux permease
MLSSSRRLERTDWRTIALLSLGFGLVGIDRFMISTLFPVIAKDLALTYDDIGLITGALAFAWGVAALIMGNKADRIGRRKVLAGSLLVFALLIGTSGLATGLAGLVVVRVAMGLADGAFTPASIAATFDAAAPRHHGVAIGVQQMMLPTFGLAVAPLAIAGLLHIIDWRWTFLTFAVPGVLLTWAVWRRLPEQTKHQPTNFSSFVDWRRVLAYRNIRIAMALMLCWLTCLITTSALLPSYLIDHVGLSFGDMSGVMSAIGLGAAAGTLLVSALSDQIGRKPAMILASAGALAALILLANAGRDPLLLFALLFVVHFCNQGAITLTVGPICAETVPAALMATASGVVIASGEIIGGGLAPVIAGTVATHFGIDQLLWLPIGALVLAVAFSLFLIETRPQERRLRSFAMIWK